MSRLLSFAASAATLIALQGCAAGSAQVEPTLEAQAATSNLIAGKPNLNGVWQALNTANWDLEPHGAQDAPVASRQLGAIGAVPAGLGVVDGGTIPYRPEALERLALNRRNRVLHDPEAACYLPGIPRATYMNYPFQIIQGGDDDILIAYEYASANRVIHMGEIGIPPIDTWMGTSYGRWEGDTLVVTTLAQGPGDVKLPAGESIDGVTWLDRAGNYLTAAATVTERFTRKGSGHLDYAVTIEDPAIYTRPWTMRMPLYRRTEANAQLLEFRCVPFSELFLYGDLLEGSE